MPDFQADIQVRAIADSSLNTIDQKIESWKRGVQSTVSFTASGLDDIERRIKSLQNTKINIGFGGVGAGGGGGGVGRGSRTPMSDALYDDIKRYNKLSKASLSAGKRERAAMLRETKSLNSRINAGLTGVNKEHFFKAQRQLSTGSADYRIAEAKIQDKAEAKAQKEALAQQKIIDRAAAAERKKDFNDMLRVQKQYDKLNAQHAATDASTEA